MRSKLVLIPAVSLCLFVPVQAALAASADGRCSLPTGLREQLTKKYPVAKVVDLGDLSDDDRGFFQKDHGNDCPGLVKVDFYGDGKPTWAVVLLTGDEQKQKADLVVAHEVSKGWETKLLDTAGGPTPVVWRQPPGKYEDVYGEKTIRAMHPAIVFAHYESWAILYAWTGKHMRKIWLMD
jgi:hypothetical protein